MAEEENARRLSTTRGQLLNLTAALLGLGFFKVLSVVPPEWHYPWVGWCFWSLTLVGAACLMAALWHLLSRPGDGSRGSSVSYSLKLPKSLIMGFQLDPASSAGQGWLGVLPAPGHSKALADTREAVFLAYRLASDRLLRANSKTEKSIGLARIALGAGLFSLSLAVASYTVGVSQAATPSGSQDVESGESNTEEHGTEQAR